MRQHSTPRSSAARALVLVASLAAAVSACKTPPDRSETAPPALWEPVDESFQGCEGG